MIYLLAMKFVKSNKKTNGILLMMEIHMKDKNNLMNIHMAYFIGKFS